MNWALFGILAVLVVGVVGGLIMWTRFGANSTDDGGQ